MEEGEGNDDNRVTLTHDPMNPMNSMNSFRSLIAWREEFADTLAFYCADGRFVAQCEDFLTNGLKVTTCDHFVFPAARDGWCWMR